MLFRKMLRDVANNKAPFIAIFLMIFLGVFIFTGVNSEWNGMQVHADKFYQETNLADVFVYSTGFQKEDITILNNTKDIDSVERRAVLDTNVKDNKKKKIALYILENHTLSKIKVMDGKEFSLQEDGIWLDESYAKENNIKVGELFSLEMNVTVITKKVQGLILHPEFVYYNSDGSVLPDHNNNGYAFVSSSYVPYSDQIPYSQLVIKTEKPTQMEQTVSQALQKNNLTFLQKEDLPSYSMLAAEITQHQAFGEVFPIIFLLIAVLTTITTVSKMIINQRLQIGILKALGFRNKKIIFHYLSHVLIIVTIGALLGYFIGPLIVPSLILPMMESLYTLPMLGAVPLSSNVLMVIGSIGLCFIVALFICYKQLKEKTATALRPAVIVYKNKRNQNSTIWKHLNFYVQWNIRDILRNKVRSLIAIVGVAGCMGLLICAMGLKDSMDNMIRMMFNDLQTYQMRVNVDPTAAVNDIKELMTGSLVSEGAIELQHDDTQKVGSLTIQEDTRYLKLQDSDTNTISLPKEGIALSYKLANSFNFKIGDTISWRIMGDKAWISSTVSEIIRTPASQGITISKDYFEKINQIFIPTAIVGLKANVDAMPGVTSVQYLQEDIAKSMDTMMEGMYLMISVLILGAVVLGIIVIYNIGTFSYFEKIREMATLKVLGFKNIQVKKLLRQQNTWLTLLGIIFGLPFGYALIYTVLSTVGDAMDIIIKISFLTYIVCIFATLLVSMLVMITVSRKVKHIDMVSALKAME